MKSDAHLLKLWDTGVHTLFTPEELDYLWDLLDRRAEFESARKRLQATLRILPLVEAEWKRGNGIYRAVSMRPQSLTGPTRPEIPWGWAGEKCYDRCALEIGPAWYILPRRWLRALRWHLYTFAIDHGALVGPEGGYFTEFEWWPKAPRMTRMERWEAEKGVHTLSERVDASGGSDA